MRNYTRFFFGRGRDSVLLLRGSLWFVVTTEAFRDSCRRTRPCDVIRDRVTSSEHIMSRSVPFVPHDTLGQDISLLLPFVPPLSPVRRQDKRSTKVNLGQEVAPTAAGVLCSSACFHWGRPVF